MLFVVEGEERGIPDALENTSLPRRTSHRSSSHSNDCGVFPIIMTSSGHFDDTHGLTSDQTHLTVSQLVAAHLMSQARTRQTRIPSHVLRKEHLEKDEQAARCAVYVVAEARAELRERRGAPENQAEQTWTSHQVTFSKTTSQATHLGKPEKKFSLWNM